MTPEEAEDKRGAAVHEAGHLTVAAALHLPGAMASIEPTNTSDPYHEHLWTGKHGFYGALPASVAVAGTVADCLDDEPGIAAPQPDFVPRARQVHGERGAPTPRTEHGDGL